jgi:hypothetical protein
VEKYQAGSRDANGESYAARSKHTNNDNAMGEKGKISILSQVKKPSGCCKHTEGIFPIKVQLKTPFSIVALLRKEASCGAEL